MNMKDVFFAVVTAFCLSCLMFTAIPIRSDNPYDPWADVDANGLINMYDIAYAASRFNTAGDSTKNVNAAPIVSFFGPWTYELNSSITTYTKQVNITGYSQVIVSASSSQIGAVVRVYDGDNYALLDEWSVQPYYALEGNTRAYPVSSSSIRVSVGNAFGIWGSLSKPDVDGTLKVELTTTPYSESVPQYKSRRSDGLYNYEQDGFNLSWVNGQDSVGSGGAPEFAGGFSRMYLSIAIMNSSHASPYGGLPYPVNVSLSSIEWTDFKGYECNEFPSKEFFNSTIGSLPMSVSVGKAIDVKGPYFYVFVQIEGVQRIAPSGWISGSIYYYLRND